MFDSKIPFHENYEFFKTLMSEKRGEKAEQDKLYYDFTTYAKQRAKNENDPKAIEWIEMEEVIGQIRDEQDKPTLTEWLNANSEKDVKPGEHVFKQLDTTDDEEVDRILDQVDKEIEGEEAECNFSKYFSDDDESSSSKKDKGSGGHAYFDDDYFKRISEKLRQETRKGSFSSIDYDDLARVERNIDKFIGLDDVKKSTKDLIAFARVQQLKRERNLTSDILNFNTAFMGEPGTGKTTMAREYGELFKALGLLQKGHVIEASRVDLIGGYVGHTEIMTQEIFLDALDGVLFIDEAHNLYDPSQYYDFGHECLSTLIKLMEDFRERVIIIFAGYQDQLERTIFKFEGMESRIPYRMNFQAFSPDEMVSIFKLICDEKGYCFSDNAKDLLFHFLKAQKRKSNKNWNGREIRNIFEKALIYQAKRLSKITNLSDEQLMTIEAEDLQLQVREAKGNIITLNDYKE